MKFQFIFYSLLILFLISTPLISVYGESEIDTDFTLYKANQYLSLNQFEKAISYFDKVIQKEPNNVEALYYKGKIFSVLGEYDEAILYFEKTLSIDPQNKYAAVELHNTLIEIASYKFRFLDGVLEIKVHDSKGGLISFQRVTSILALKHELTEKLIEKWPIINVIEKKNQKFSIHQQEFNEILDRDTLLGFHEIPYSEKVDFPITSTWHYQIPVEKGDVVSYVYSFYRPVI